MVIMEKFMIADGLHDTGEGYAHLIGPFHDGIEIQGNTVHIGIVAAQAVTGIGDILRFVHQFPVILVFFVFRQETFECFHEVMIFLPPVFPWIQPVLFTP